MGFRVFYNGWRISLCVPFDNFRINIVPIVVSFGALCFQSRQRFFQNTPCTMVFQGRFHGSNGTVAPVCFLGVRATVGYFFIHFFDTFHRPILRSARGTMFCTNIFKTWGYFLDGVGNNGKVRSKIINPIYTNTRGGRKNMVSQLPGREVMWTLKYLKLLAVNGFLKISHVRERFLVQRGAKKAPKP